MKQKILNFLCGFAVFLWGLLELLLGVVAVFLAKFVVSESLPIEISFVYGGTVIFIFVAIFVSIYIIGKVIRKRLDWDD